MDAVEQAADGDLGEVGGGGLGGVDAGEAGQAGLVDELLQAALGQLEFREAVALDQEAGPEEAEDGLAPGGVAVAGGETASVRSVYVPNRDRRGL